ncbi:MAG: type II CAAX endopeptidase family protein [Acidobacteriota bacterium]
MTIDSAPGPGPDESVTGDLDVPSSPNGSGAAPWVDPQRESFLVGLLAILVVAIVALQAMAPTPAASDEPTPPAQRVDLLLQGRYTLGASWLFERLGTLGEAQAAQLAGSLERLDAEPAAAICWAPVLDALGDRDAADRVLGVAPSALDGDAALAARWLRDEADGRDETADEALVRHCGWFGELALADARDDEAALADLRGDAVRLTVAVLAVALLAFGGLLVGSFIALFAYVNLRRGALTSGYRRDLDRVGAAVPGPARLAYLETMVFFLLGLQLLGVVTAVLFQTGIGTVALLAQWAIVPLMFWPLRRGETRATLAAAIGWAKPASPLVEVACGLLAYLASAPLLALGLVGSILMSQLVPQTPYHPVMDWVQGGDSMIAVLMVYMVATIWAPVVEETMFRGAFYHYLRGRFGVVRSAVLVALVFALIHPQGAIGVPFLTALAVALAWTREWRGSMLASMTMHAVHNALAITFLFVVLGGG